MREIAETNINPPGQYKYKTNQQISDSHLRGRWDPRHHVTISACYVFQRQFNVAHNYSCPEVSCAKFFFTNMAIFKFYKSSSSSIHHAHMSKLFDPYSETDGSNSIAVRCSMHSVPHSHWRNRCYTTGAYLPLHRIAPKRDTGNRTSNCTLPQAPPRHRVHRQWPAYTPR